MGESSTPADDTLSGALHLRRERPIALCRWFVFFAALLAALGCLWLFLPQSSPFRPYTWFLGYMSVACTFLPLPTAWLICTLAGPMGLSPFLVATVGTVGTCIANMNDYYIVTFLYRYRPVRRIRLTRLYKRMVGWYERAPFVALASASFLPIPVDVVRLLAVSEGYSRWRFIAASFIGRWPRYLLFAILTKRFSLGWQWIVGILVVTAAVGLWHGVPRLVDAVGNMKRRKHNSAAEREGEDGK